MSAELSLYIIKLILGGIAAFLAILFWSKTRDSAWMCIVAGTVIAYAGVVVDMMCSLGIIIPGAPYIFGISFLILLFAVIPTLFYIAALVLMLLRESGYH